MVKEAKEIKEKLHGHEQKARPPILKTLRGRLLVAFFLASMPVIGIAIFTVIEMRKATAADIERATLRLATAVSVSGKSADLLADLPTGSEWGVIDGKGVVVERLPGSGDWTGKTLPEEDLKIRMLSVKQGALETEGIDGTRRLYAFAMIGGDDFETRYAYLGLPSVEAYQSSRTAEARLAIISITSTLLVLMAALALADLIIVRRVRRNMEVIRRIAIGDIGAQKSLMYGFGEMDDLAALIDRMASKLKTAYETTEQKVKSRTAEIELRQGFTELEKARTEALLSNIGEGVIYVDAEGRIGYVNAEAERATGFAFDETKGAPLSAVFRLEDEKGNLIPEEKRPATLAMQTGEKVDTPVHPKPYYYVRKDKTRFPIHITVTPVSLDGHIMGAIAVFQDITDEMEFDQRKSEFISIASHQLRSPLSATKWLADMLRKGDVGKLTPKQQELADKLFEANEKMVVMVNDLLNVSRIESGVIKPTLAPIDLTALVKEVLRDTEPLIAQKKQTLVQNIPALPKVMADALLTREVFANFISNATKYTPDGGTVTVSMESKEGQVIVNVKDTGIGIPKKDNSQMFKKFFRAENATKSTVQGTGLGLYVCRSIIELSGGRIGFDSEEGKGTTFYFTLRVAPPA